MALQSISANILINAAPPGNRNRILRLRGCGHSAQDAYVWLKGAPVRASILSGTAPRNPASMRASILSGDWPAGRSQSKDAGLRIEALRGGAETFRCCLILCYSLGMSSHPIARAPGRALFAALAAVILVLTSAACAAPSGGTTQAAPGATRGASAAAQWTTIATVRAKPTATRAATRKAAATAQPAATATPRAAARATATPDDGLRLSLIHI